MDSRTLVECDNVNGVKLSLKMLAGNISRISTATVAHTPKSRKFIITYKSERNRNSWAKASLFVAILFNIVVFSYIQISFMAFAYITLICSFLACFWITHSVQSESLLVIPTVGIQSTVKYVWGKEDNFISWNSIDDVIINETITMRFKKLYQPRKITLHITLTFKCESLDGCLLPLHARTTEQIELKFCMQNRVLFLLTVLVKPNSESNKQETVKLVPMFQNTKPRLMMLEKVYSELQALMREIVKDQTEASGDKG